jgi:peroxiredoxin
MGKAARVKKERRQAPAARPPRDSRRMSGARRTRLVWGGTGAVALVVVAIVGTLLATRSSAKPPAKASSVSASDRTAPASLVAAASRVGFHPTTEPGTGVVESQPASAAPAPTSTTLLSVGSKAPGFTLKTPQGTSVSLSQFRGKVVLLEFFATWCPHCNAEAPHLDRLYASLPHSRYAFLAVNADGETAPSVFAFHRYYGIRYPALVDPGAQPGSFSQQGDPGPVTTKYGVEYYPTFYVIDGKGRITWRSDGEQPDVLLRQELKAARG